MHVGPLSTGGWTTSCPASTAASTVASAVASTVASAVASVVASTEPSVPLVPLDPPLEDVPLEPPLDVVPLDPPLDVEPLDPSPLDPLLLAVPELDPVPASSRKTALSSPHPTKTTFIMSAAPATAMTPHGRFLMAPVYRSAQ